MNDEMNTTPVTPAEETPATEEEAGTSTEDQTPAEGENN